MDKNQYKWLSISKTEGEWEIIDQKIRLLNKSNLLSYLRSEVPKLQRKIEDCPECISNANGEIKERRPYIDKYQYETIKKIAVKMKVHPSVVIDRLLISPLLLPD